MIVDERTDTKFVLRIRPQAVGLMTVILVFLLALDVVGAALIVRQVAQPDFQYGVMVMCAVTLLHSALFVFGLRTITLTIDRWDGTVTIRRTNPAGWYRERTVPVADVQQAEVEVGTADDGGATYRLVLRRIDGGMLPVAYYFDFLLGDKQTIADAVNQYLGVESPLLPTRV